MFYKFLYCFYSIEINMNIKEEIIKKINNINSFDNIDKTAYQLSQEISKYLSDEIEELNVYSHVFRHGMEKCFNKVLNTLQKQPQSVVVFPDSIPGFTMMVFKKMTIKKPETVDSQKKEFVVNELTFLEPVINKFFEKNHQKILLIENNDLLFAMFPVSDAKKYLKEMDLYITF